MKDASYLANSIYERWSKAYLYPFESNILTKSAGLNAKLGFLGCVFDVTEIISRIAEDEEILEWLVPYCRPT